MSAYIPPYHTVHVFDCNVCTSVRAVGFIECVYCSAMAHHDKCASVITEGNRVFMICKDCENEDL